jgi:hypothetical protein
MLTCVCGGGQKIKNKGKNYLLLLFGLLHSAHVPLRMEPTRRGKKNAAAAPEGGAVGDTACDTFHPKKGGRKVAQAGRWRKKKGWPTAPLSCPLFFSGPL